MAMAPFHNDKQDLGVNWIQKFLGRRDQLKAAYIPPLDKERAMAQDRQIFEQWFTLYSKIRTSGIWMRKAF
jgi:hypothetical protein